MKATLFFLLAVSLIGCGGIPPTLTADQVFSNRAEVWKFQNSYGDITTVEVMPQPDGSTVWHYTKNADRAYWAEGVKGGELYFNLEKDANGAWYSTGGHIIMPFGCPWCDGPVDASYGVGTDAGKQRPYMIVPAQSFAQRTIPNETTFLDSNDPNTRWETATATEWVQTPVYTGWAMTSDQIEGSCTHEKWYFAPNLGLVKVETPNDGGSIGNPTCANYGGTIAHDHHLWMVRIP